MKTVLTIFFTILIFFYVFNFLALNRKFYAFLHWQLRLPINQQTLVKARKQVLDFIKDKGELDYTLFTERERAHLYDIKVVMEAEKLVFLAYVDIFLIIYFVYFIVKKNKDVTEMFLHASKFGLFLASVLAFVAILGFVPMFTILHTLIFPNTFWQLDYETHLLINILPPRFFLVWMIYFFILSFLVFGILYAVTSWGVTKSGFKKISPHPKS